LPNARRGRALNTTKVRALEAARRERSQQAAAELVHPLDLGVLERAQQVELGRAEAGRMIREAVLGVPLPERGVELERVRQALRSLGQRREALGGGA
jgi:hypothetical protein